MLDVFERHNDALEANASGFSLSSDETIAAIATPPGHGGRAMVRLSGPAAWPIALAAFRDMQGLPLGNAPLQSHAVLHGSWVLETSRYGAMSIPVRLYMMRTPRTYTREDVVEIHLPGNPALAEHILADCCAGHGERAGRARARLARGGEFTLRAFLSGRIDLAQAESVEMLIAAHSEAERQAALQHLDGDVSRSIRAWRERLVMLAAMIEGALDFEDDEFEPFPEETIADVLSQVREELDAVRAGAGAASPARGAIPVFFAGLTNAGKSSLLNALVGYEGAFVSAERSTTRDVLEFDYVIPPFRFILQDAPGLDSDVSDMARLASGLAQRAGRMAGVVIFAVDGSVEPDTDLTRLRASLPDVPMILVMTKCDFPACCPIEEMERYFAPTQQVLSVSTVTGEGLDELRAALLDLAVGDVEHACAGGALTVRVSDELARAAEALERATFLVREGMPEIVAEELRSALAALGLCVGEGYAEDVLESIFSRFCIGK